MSRVDPKVVEILRRLGDSLSERVSEIKERENEIDELKGKLRVYEDFLQRAGETTSILLELSGRFEVNLNVFTDSEAEAARSEIERLEAEILELETDKSKLQFYQEKLHNQFPELILLVRAEVSGNGKSAQEADYFARFNLDHFKLTIANHYDENYILIVDGYNAIGSIRRYDYRAVGCQLGECRDKLVKDLDFLASQISGKIMVVFDTIHNYSEKLVHDVQVVFPDNRMSSKQSGDNHIVERTKELVADGNSVFVLSNDNDLGDRIKLLSAKPLKLGEVFKY